MDNGSTAVGEMELHRSGFLTGTIVIVRPSYGYHYTAHEFNAEHCVVDLYSLQIWLLFSWHLFTQICALVIEGILQESAIG